VTYSCEAVVPLVNDMSVILVVQLVGKVCAAARRTKHRHKAWVVAALLNIDIYNAFLASRGKQIITLSHD